MAEVQGLEEYEQLEFLKAIEQGLMDIKNNHTVTFGEAKKRLSANQTSFQRRLESICYE